MSKKVTKEKFIQVIENNRDGLTNVELAALLKISVSYFYKLRHEHLEEIKIHTVELAKSLALEQVTNLARNARKGDTAAAKTILEMAGAYIPASKQKLEVAASNIGVIQVPAKKPVGAPVE